MDSKDYSQAVHMDEGIKRILQSTRLFNHRYLLDPLLISGIHRAVLDSNVHAVKLMVESGVSVNTEHHRHGISPLHLAVIINSLDILEYLLSKDSILVDGAYRKNITPLQVAAQLGHIEAVRKLIDAGADVNLGDFRGDTPLHKSLRHPEVAHLLVQKGAHINAVNCEGESPLHHVANANHESVYMLLYYNADTDVYSNDDYTPFMCALMSRNLEIQLALFEYVNDFTEPNVLDCALSYDARLVRYILERGADINYVYRRIGSPGILAVVLDGRCSPDVFKLVWDRICYSQMKCKFSMTDLFLAKRGTVSNYLQVVIDSDNFAPAVESIIANRNFCAFVASFANHRLKLEQLTTFACRLLEYGFCATSVDVSEVFCRYGFCELLKILLYTEIDNSMGLPGDRIIARMLIDFDYELDEKEVDYLTGWEREIVLDYFTCVHIARRWDNKRGELPSLIELARNSARKHIWNSLGVKTTCQFYTAIDELQIPLHLKKLLTFEKKL